MRRLSALIFLAALFCAAVAAATQQAAAQQSAGEMMSFADSLFAQGDYYRAITEYERVIFFYPKDPLAKTARFQIAESYFKGKKFDEAIDKFSGIARDYRNEEVGIRALFRTGEVFYKKRDYRNAADTFGRFIAAYPKDPRADAARMKLGWSHLEQGDWTRAEEEFRGLPADSLLRGKADLLAEEVKHYPDIPKRSPVLAGIMSGIVPGAGQLYINRPKDALISLLLNGGFIWGTVESFEHENYATGGVLGFFALSWYTGNIYNAINGAYKYNRRSKEGFLKSLHDRFDLSYRHEGHGNMLVFSMKF